MMKVLAGELKRITIDSLTLTGTGPEWNEIIIRRAETKPSKLRKLFKEQKIKKPF